MNKDKIISIKCYCGGDHCEGELYIQPDKIKDQKLWMVTVTDTGGSDQSNMWITDGQLEHLINELKRLLKE